MFRIYLFFNLYIWVSVATQQGPRERSVGMDFQRIGRKGSIWPIWRYFTWRSCPLQISQQIGSRIGEKDPRARHQFSIDGKCTTLPSGHQEIRCAWRGNLPNGRLVWTSQHPTSYIVFVFIGSHRKWIWGKNTFCKWRCSFIWWHFFRICFCTAFRLKSIPNSMDQRWDQRWLTKMNDHSRTHNCAHMKENWTCKWASTKVPHNPDTEDSAILATCKLLFALASQPNSFYIFNI